MNKHAHPAPWTPVLNNPDHPPYDGANYPGKHPAIGNRPGFWSPAADGDMKNLIGQPPEIPPDMYDNVTGNPLWYWPSTNESYVWNGTIWAQ